MTDTLPEPKSRKESYLAKAAGMDVTIPEKPESRIEQYLNAIAGGGAGGGGIPTTVIDTIWFGTQAEYDLIDPKAEKTLYLIQEETDTPVTLNMASPRNLNLDPITRTVEIEPSIEDLPEELRNEPENTEER